MILYHVTRIKSQQNSNRFELDLTTRINRKFLRKSRIFYKIQNVYTDVSIRGIQGRVYHCKETNRVIGIITEGKFTGQIMKAQPISERQLESLRELNILN